MLVRLFMVVFGNTNASLFGRIGYFDDGGRFISNDAASILTNKPIDAIRGVISAYKDGFLPPQVEINGNQFAVDLTEIETAFV